MAVLINRRIAQWQGACLHTDEAKAFAARSSCATSPHLLFLSHCVPYPPDKGDRIRAYYLLRRLTQSYRVHVACFARTAAELEHARKLDRCASVYVEYLPKFPSLARAGLRFLGGGCLTTSFFGSRRLSAHVAEIAKLPPAATVAYSSAMAQYAPRDVPLLLDMVDVDSEKWLQYAEVRRAGCLYRAEGRRLRRLESEAGERALCTTFATEPEMRLFQQFAPRTVAGFVENAVDFAYFDPEASPSLPELSGRRYAMFLGAMSYFPNADAVSWFAETILARVRQRQPAFEFLVVGRDPTARVKRLASRAGVTVTGAVPDVRPYLLSAQAVVAPLRIARGIQNKVLEALAMGKPVLASEAVCKTFGREIPKGVIRCEREEDYASAIESSGFPDAEAIRGAARKRFSWDNLDLIVSALKDIGTQRRLVAARE